MLYGRILHTRIDWLVPGSMLIASWTEVLMMGALVAQSVTLSRLWAATLNVALMACVKQRRWCCHCCCLRHLATVALLLEEAGWTWLAQPWAWMAEGLPAASRCQLGWSLAPRRPQLSQALPCWQEGTSAWTETPCCLRLMHLRAHTKEAISDFSRSPCIHTHPHSVSMTWYP